MIENFILIDRVCTTCKVSKKLTEFHKHKKCKYGVNSVCKICDSIESRNWREKNKELIPTKKRNYLMKARYGTTVENYELMFQRQGGICLICKKSQKRRLDVDHSHKTGKIRGLLCRRCNIALGLLDDNVSIIKNLINYLEEK